MPRETCRGFTYGWMFEEREHGVTEALVEQETTSVHAGEETAEEAEEEAGIAATPLGAVAVEQTLAAVPYSGPAEYEAHPRNARAVIDPVAQAV